MQMFAFSFGDFVFIAISVLIIVLPFVIFDALRTKKRLGMIRCRRCHHVGKPRMNFVPFKGTTPVCAECGSTDWEKIKRAEKHGTRHARPSALDGIPKHLPALLWVGKLVKKAHKAKLLAGAPGTPARTKKELAERLFALAQFAQEQGWSAEDLLRGEAKKRERALRRREKLEAKSSKGG